MKTIELKQLLKDMSLDEKIGQLVQLSGEFFQANDISYGPITKLGISQKVVDLAGSVLNVAGAEETRRVQNHQMKVQPHHIPVMFMSDVIYGYKTVYPIPIGLGASWDPKLVKEAFNTAADEASAAGIHVAYAPMLDTVHDARWGRVLESPGEDPYLNSVYAKAMVEGFQENFENNNGVAACFKHFAGYGAVESGREYNSIDMSISNLYQNYLPAYKSAVKAGAKMAMTSLTSLNGVPSTADEKLLNELLRKIWGFNGIIISDYASIYELVKHGFASDEYDAAHKAINATVDIDMKSPCYANSLKKLVADGKLNEEKIDESVWRVLSLKNELGLFEDPYRGTSVARENKSVLSSDKRELARKLASEAIVMLQNKNDVLPLNKNEKIALIGPYSTDHSLLGMWAVHGEPKDSVSILEGIERYTSNVTATKGTDINRSREMLKEMGFPNDEEISKVISDQEIEHENNEKALQLAKKADVVILALGESTLEAGEAGAKTKLTLPENQLNLINEISKLGKKVVLLVISGRPLVLTNIVDKVDSILECWFPGTEGGAAIADILFGKANPSGRLTMSFPCSSGQEPIYYNHLSTGRPVDDSQHVGRFVSKYLDTPAAPLYPFGFGLSYGKVTYESMSLDKDVLTHTGKIEAKVVLKNDSDWDCQETVQLYLHDKVATIVQPVKKLINFKRVSIKAHTQKTVSFSIIPKQLTFFDNYGEEILENGDFTLFIGSNSRDCLAKDFTLTD